ncbi:MAG: hypothetical protein ACREXI_12165 [Caldimonas sp.]
MLLLAASSVHAQAYRCTAGGSSYFSDRPCTTSANARLGMYGPARSAVPMPNGAQAPAAPKAQEHVKYLTSDCASISEAIRTGPSRGVRGDVIRELHDEYNQKCNLEDQDARKQLQQEKSQQQALKLAQRDGAANERQQAQARLEWCAGLRDVIALKRKRESTLNATEVGSLRDLEQTYNHRCLAR